VPSEAAGISVQDEPVESCAILTTRANGLMRRINGRMQVIVPPDQYSTASASFLEGHAG
jgi:putative SOS response-associated peptidase YedK